MYRRERFVMVLGCFVSAVVLAFALRNWQVEVALIVVVCGLIAISGSVLAVSSYLDETGDDTRSLAMDRLGRVLINVCQITLTLGLFSKIPVPDVREFLLSMNLAATFVASVHAVVFPRTRVVVLFSALLTSTVFSLTLLVRGYYLLAATTAIYSLGSTAISIYLNRERVRLLELRFEAEEARYHDNVTDLLNRLGLQSRLLGQTSTEGKPSTLVLVDLDRFKSINDSFGHRVGDEVLRSTAKRLREALPVRTYLARTDGDEFAFVLPWPTDAIDTESVMSTVMEALAAPYPIARQGIQMTVSVGMAALDSPAGLEVALREADTAVQDSKRVAGHALSVFNGLRHVGSMRRGEVEQRFRTALLNEEIDFWLQPIFLADTLIPSAVEVLARWPGANNSRITPQQFVELASQTGLIMDLGSQALRRAGSILRDWDQVPELRRIGVNVNVAPIQLEHGLLEEVTQEIGLDLLHRLHIELVEGDPESVGNTNVTRMETLLRQGIGITLDDFGTGNASMTNLRLYPFTGVKIDRSFVQHIDQSYVNRGLVTSIIQMARALDLRVALQGISTPAEFEVARELGPDAGQGFWLMPPMPTTLVRKALLSYLQNIEGVSHTMRERLQVLHASWYDLYQSIPLSQRETEMSRVIDDIMLPYRSDAVETTQPEVIGANGPSTGHAVTLPGCDEISGQAPAAAHPTSSGE